MGPEGMDLKMQRVRPFSVVWKKVNVTLSSSRRARRRIQAGLTLVPEKLDVSGSYVCVQKDRRVIGNSQHRGTIYAWPA